VNVDGHATVSVVIPVYNVGPYLERCISSVLSQTMSQIEVIAVDDGSTDLSGALLDCFAIRDGRLHIIHQANAGVSRARNVGLEAASGKYLYVMDADDWLASDALQTMVDELENDGCDVVFTDHTLVYPQSQRSTHLFSREFVCFEPNVRLQLQKMVLSPKYSPFPPDGSVGSGIAPPWTYMARREVISLNNLRFVTTTSGIFDDGLFTMSVLEVAKGVSYVRRPCYFYRVLQSSISHRYNPDRPAIHRAVFKEVRCILGDPIPSEFRSASAARSFSYFMITCKTYLFHPENHESWHVRYDSFGAFVRSSENREAFRDLDVERLSKRQRVVAWLGAHRMVLPLWLLIAYHAGRERRASASGRCL